MAWLSIVCRCKLIKKPKLDQQPLIKENFHATEMVAFHLSKCDDSRNPEAMRRILMFVREQSAVFEGKDLVIFSFFLHATLIATIFSLPNCGFAPLENGIHFYGGEVQVRLELVQEFNKISVEAKVMHRSKDETAPIVLSPLPTFPSAVSCSQWSQAFVFSFCFSPFMYFIPFNY